MQAISSAARCKQSDVDTTDAGGCADAHNVYADMTASCCAILLKRAESTAAAVTAAASASAAAALTISQLQTFLSSVLQISNAQRDALPSKTGLVTCAAAALYLHDGVSRSIRNAGLAVRRS